MNSTCYIATPQNWKMKDTTKKKIDIYSCVLILRVTQLQTEHQM